MAVSDTDVGVGVCDVEEGKVEADEACVVIVADEGESEVDCDAEVEG